MYIDKLIRMGGSQNAVSRRIGPLYLHYRALSLGTSDHCGKSVDFRRQGVCTVDREG